MIKSLRQIEAERDWAKHGLALTWLNSLILDLKVQLGGHTPHEPITAERLAEWDHYRRDIEACRERIEVMR